MKEANDTLAEVTKRGGEGLAIPCDGTTFLGKFKGDASSDSFGTPGYNRYSV